MATINTNLPVTTDTSSRYHANTPTTAREEHSPPSPTSSDRTLRTSQEGLNSRCKDVEGSPRGLQHGSTRRGTSSSQGSEHKDSNASADIDLEKQKSRRSNMKDEQDDHPDPNIVRWDGDDDPENPQNFSILRKSCITLSMGSLTLCCTFASSIFSTATMATAKVFGVSSEVMTLGTSLFVLGFAFGPLIWGPMSELYGRKPPLFIGFFIFAIFNIPVAVAQNLQTIFLCRFFGGLFASAPLAVVGGALADFWDPVNRGIAIAVFSGATFIGPVLSPIIGGFITMSYLGWRWTQWITLILTVTFGTIGFFVIPETYAPVLLTKRAKKRRHETKNWALHSQAEESPIDMKTIATKYLFRPFMMIILEPILILVTIYMSVIYGIIYLFFSAYPIAFQQYRGWNQGVGALPFLALIIGVAFGVGLIAWTSKTKFKHTMEKEGKVIPEARLPPMMVGGFVFPAGMFWFAWTSSPHITWVPQVLSGIPIGMGLLLIFLQGLNYIVDVYAMNANSAIAANTFVRSIVGAGFPMFATYMYNRLGVNWASSTLGFITAAMFPIPIIFYYYGAKIRSWSRYTPEN